ncbi:MAG: hypothetical protein KDA62_15470 [Planctomycetales bacterium]|nr:hypothetical protein [Planctomycetales bacterium]
MLCCPFRVAVKRKLNCVLLFLIALMLFTRASAVAADAPSAIPVKLELNGQQWRLTRGGQPFSIRGVGGDGSLDLLSKSGGNSVRTWDVDDKTERLLDEAHRLGITVTLGIWLGHERHGFRYTSFDDVTAQTEKVRAAVERFKNHPAVLMWALGNEMEGYDGGDNPAIWQHVESLAAIVKRLDPQHPVMTVVAEIGGRRVQAIHRFCPSIDIVGINSYAGAASLPRRYREAGGTKPYVVTEYGVPGFWEVPKNDLGSVDEPTSTTKAESYRRTYQALSDDQALCLGSFAFIWGHKQEATATWFGMMLPDGKKLAAVDAMTELWSGSPPTNRCPRIERLEIKGSARLKPGATFQASLTASDPESDSIKVRWVLTEDSQQFPTGGDFQAAPIGFPEAIGNADERQATITMPRGGGHYRLYVFVSDSQGGAATANVPLFVDGPIVRRPGTKAKLPLVVVADELEAPPFAPSGWMGEHTAVKVDERSTDAPHTGDTCLRVDYARGDGWAGVAWQSPPDDWGDRPGGFDLSGAKRLTFWARGAKGGERVKFGVGLIGNDKPYSDSAKVEIEVPLTTDWRQYEIDLADRDLTRIKTGFVWVVAGQQQPLRFYLDDVRYE